jgi:hypothetical protein
VLRCYLHLAGLAIHSGVAVTVLFAFSRASLPNSANSVKRSNSVTVFVSSHYSSAINIILHTVAAAPVARIVCACDDDDLKSN